MPAQRLSRKGREFIFEEEGVVRYAYNDKRTASNPNPPDGNATFGVGHLIHRGPVTAADRKRWGTVERPAPMSRVIEVFNEDIEKYEGAVRRAVGRQMWQHRFDACVSLAFNIGAGAFFDSTLAKILRERRRGFSERAADEFLKWKRAGSDPDMLLPRRKRERHLFLTGHYHLED